MHSVSSALFIARNVSLQKSSPTEKSAWAFPSALFPLLFKMTPWGSRKGGGVARTPIQKEVTGAVRATKAELKQSQAPLFCLLSSPAHNLLHLQLLQIHA